MSASGAKPLRESLQEYARGVAGGLIFSLPLLFTMEVWQFGHTITPQKLLVALGAAFLMLLAYNRYAGLRPDASFVEVVIDSVEELGLGLVISALVLAVLGRVEAGMSGPEILGAIVLESLIVAIGVSVGTAQLGGQSENEDYGEKPHSFAGQLAVAACGAMLFSMNVAPTEEVFLLGVEMSALQLLLLTLLSLALAAMVLNFSNFRGSQQLTPVLDRLPAPLATLLSAMTTYVVALGCAAAVLWFFGRFENVPAMVCLAQSVVLGFVGTLGASAGRLLLQSN